MPKLLSSREVVSALEHQGFIFVSQRGSHAKFRKLQGREMLTVIVPMSRKEIPFGTFRSILRQSQLPKEDFYARA